MITNMMRGKGEKPVTVGDFMPADREEIDPIDETWDNLRQLAESKNGKS